MSGITRTVTPPATISAEVAVADLERDAEIETTLEELEGYQIVKAIACDDVKPQRITHRDAKSYFAVLLDDNNRKPIARLHFNGKQRYTGLLDEAKVETHHPIGEIYEIYTHADGIREAVHRYSERLLARAPAEFSTPILTAAAAFAAVMSAEAIFVRNPA